MATPAFAQQGKLIGVIRNDRHHDSVKDLLKSAGCRTDWAEQAYKDSDIKRRQEKNWKTGWIFSKDKKLPIGTRIYLVDADNCDMKPKDVAKLKLEAGVEAREVAKALRGQAWEMVQKLPSPEIRVPDKPVRMERQTARGPAAKPPVIPKPENSHSGIGKSGSGNESPGTLVPPPPPPAPPLPPTNASFWSWAKAHPWASSTLVLLVMAEVTIMLWRRKGPKSPTPIKTTAGPGIPKTP